MVEYDNTLGRRINQLLDLSDVRSKADYDREIFKASRKHPDLLNFFGLKRGERMTGNDKLWNLSITQNSIAKSPPVSDYKGVYLPDNMKKKYYD